MIPANPFKRVLLVVSVLLVALIAAFLIWLNQDADPQAPILPTSTPLPEAQLFRVSADDSALRVTVDSSMGEIEGGYEMSGGTVELNREGEGWRMITNLSFDARTLSIGNETLNDVLRRALKVDEFPTGTFVAESTTLLTDLDMPQSVDLTGQIELHGAVQDYTIPTQVEIAGDRITLHAELIIDAEQFGASVPSLLAENELNGDLTVVAMRAQPD